MIDRVLPRLLHLRQELGLMFYGLAVLMCLGYIIELEPEVQAPTDANFSNGPKWKVFGHDRQRALLTSVGTLRAGSRTAARKNEDARDLVENFASASSKSCSLRLHVGNSVLLWGPRRGGSSDY